MNKKLYVSNLEWGVNDNELRDCFSQAGEVQEATVILDRDTGRSRGFGFVTMATEDGVKTAIQELDGKTVNGRQLVVQEAESKPGEEDSEFVGALKRFVLSGAKPGDSMGFMADKKHFTITRDEITSDKDDRPSISG